MTDDELKAHYVCDDAAFQCGVHGSAKALLEELLEARKYKPMYEQLQGVYNKLADQWNVFQATNRPDNRNIQRAEGAGEMARKLAEILLGVAYGHDVRDILRKFLDQQENAGGQEVEAYPAGRLPTARRLRDGEDAGD